MAKHEVGCEGKSVQGVMLSSHVRINHCVLSL